MAAGGWLRLSCAVPVPGAWPGIGAGAWPVALPRAGFSGAAPASRRGLLRVAAEALACRPGSASERRCDPGRCDQPEPAAQCPALRRDSSQVAAAWAFRPVSRWARPSAAGRRGEREPRARRPASRHDWSPAVPASAFRPAFLPEPSSAAGAAGLPLRPAARSGAWPARAGGAAGRRFRPAPDLGRSPAVDDADAPARAPRQPGVRPAEPGGAVLRAERPREGRLHGGGFRLGLALALRLFLLLGLGRCLRPFGRSLLLLLRLAAGARLSFAFLCTRSAGRDDDLLLHLDDVWHRAGLENRSQGAAPAG